MAFRVARPLAAKNLLRCWATACLARQNGHISLRRSASSASAILEDTPNTSFRDALSKGRPLKGDTEDSILPSFFSLRGKISESTLDAIVKDPYKLSTTTPVQAEVLPLLPQLSRGYIPDEKDGPPRDLLVRAKTGTGKTLAFLVPAIEARIRAIEEAGNKAVREAGLASDPQLKARAEKAFARGAVGTLVISPTRELAVQIAQEAFRLTTHHAGWETRLFTGGTNKGLQKRDFMNGRRDIVVATPGRLRDVLSSEPEVARSMSRTQLLILDEADTLLDMGFRDDIEAIKEYLPPNPERQTFLFSATVSPAIQQVARSFLDRNHRFVNCVSEEESSVHEHIAQYHTILPSAKDQLPHLLRLIAHDQLVNPGKSKIIMFMPTTRMTQLFATLFRELVNTLPAGNMTRVFEIHSRKDQAARTKTSDAFKNVAIGASVLMTSDVSARGVDYPGVTRVIQVGIPQSTTQYIHRLGRTGRAGGSATGRGDLVLLPCEKGFVTWQLAEFPLKPLTLEELTKDVAQLAEKHDIDPSAFFPPSEKALRTRSFDRGKGVSYPLSRFPHEPLAPAISPESTNQQIASLLQYVDPEAVRETVMSLLGYYISKQTTMRVQTSVIVQSIKDWAVDTCGLPVPPYISEEFLRRIGLDDQRTKKFGMRKPMGDDVRRRRDFSVARGNFERPSRPWEGRGAQRSKGQYQGFNKDRDFDNRGGDMKESRSRKYSRAPRY